MSAPVGRGVLTLAGRDAECGAHRPDQHFLRLVGGDAVAVGAGEAARVAVGQIAEALDVRNRTPCRAAERRPSRMRRH